MNQRFQKMQIAGQQALEAQPTEFADFHSINKRTSSVIVYVSGYFCKFLDFKMRGGRLKGDRILRADQILNLEGAEVIDV